MDFYGDLVRKFCGFICKIEIVAFRFKGTAGSSFECLKVFWIFNVSFVTELFQIFEDF